MSLPKEFKNLLNNVEYMCDEAEENDLSVCLVLDLMTPIGDSSLLYGFASIVDYINASNALFDAIWQPIRSCQHIMNDPTFREPLFVFRHILLMETWPWEKGPARTKRFRGFIVTVVLDFSNNSCIVTIHKNRGGNEFGDVSFNLRNLPVSVFKHEIFKRLNSKKNIECRKRGFNVWETNDLNAARVHRDDLTQYFKQVCDEREDTSRKTHMFAFNENTCRREAEDFRRRANMKHDVGIHAANYTRYKPGNDGFTESAEHFASLVEYTRQKKVPGSSPDLSNDKNFWGNTK